MCERVSAVEQGVVLPCQSSFPLLGCEPLLPSLPCPESSAPGPAHPTAPAFLCPTHTSSLGPPSISSAALNKNEHLIAHYSN